MTPMLLLDGHGSRFESSLNTSKKATTNGPSYGANGLEAGDSAEQNDSFKISGKKRKIWF